MPMLGLLEEERKKFILTQKVNIDFISTFYIHFFRFTPTCQVGNANTKSADDDYDNLQTQL